MPFQINGSTPPEGGVPVGNGYMYELPEAEGLDGEGQPCGAVGYPQVTLSFDWMNDTAWDWYKDFTGEDPSVDLTSLQVYNPFAATPGWVTYSNSAVMHRPTYRALANGIYRNVKILFTKLS